MAALAVVVVDRAVLGAAVVPERQRARRPAHAAGELGPRLLRLQEFDQRRALLLAHVAKADGVAAADVQGLAPGLRMGARHRVLGLERVGLVGAVDLHRADALVHVAASAAVLEARAVHAHQGVDQLLHAVRQGVVGRARVGEQRVAAARRRLDRIQQRSERRLRKVGGIGMPAAAEVLRLLRLLDDLEEIGIVRHPGHERVMAGRAEALADRHLVGRREPLAAKHEHHVLDERAPDLVPGRLVLEPGERHAADFGAECAGERFDGDAFVAHACPACIQSRRHSLSCARFRTGGVSWANASPSSAPVRSAATSAARWRIMGSTSR